ncbi:hypothetical protein INT45_007655 [Circinella minor]|uniref:Pentacotripeptide-repeat region of PRORP domain-containing protein n=1 Tax=Circinella minor TaxID=1195481 RepID=A0A8H7VJP4_9FUNG|nr:hypothetical protein INT45_007655 [Circinella minor]
MLLGSCLCPTQRHVSRNTRSLLFSVHNNLKTKHTNVPPNTAFCRPLSYYKYSDLNTKYTSSQHILPSCTPRLYRGLSTCQPASSFATRSILPLTDEVERVENDVDDEGIIADDAMLQRIDSSPVDILALIENAEKKQKQLEVDDDKNKNSSDKKRRRQTTSADDDRPYCSITDLEIMVNTHQFSQALEALCHTHRLTYYPTNIRYKLYSKIAQLDAPDIVQLIRPWAISHDSDNTRVWRVIRETSKFLNRDKMIKMVQYCCESNTEEDERLQLHLFTRFLSDYRNHEIDMNSLLRVIPQMNSISIKLFNMAMNIGLRQKRMEDVEFLLHEMETRKVDLDAASFNILIRSKLKQGKWAVKSAKAIYDEMESRNVNPTMATFNTFIDYSCRYFLWDDLEMWMDRMKDKGLHGNSITSRILLDVMLTQKYKSRIAEAFERVALIAPMSADEDTLNPVIAILLRHKRTLTALSLLDKIFLPFQHEPLSSSLPPPTIYAYNLLIHGLSQKGDLEAAHQVLDAMIFKKDHRIPQPDIVSYTTLIHGYIRKAESYDIDINAILRLYQQMCASGLKSNDTLHAVLLHGIIKSRHVKIDKARRLFDMMIEEDDKKRRVGDEDEDEDERLNQAITYNLMMDGYFLHTYYRNQRYGLTTSSIEPQLILLEDAIKKKLKLTTSSLNIWIRGVVIFNKDLYAAEALIRQFKQLDIRPNERTMWYICRTAYLKGRYDMARRWLEEYETEGRIIRGRGLCELKKQLRI